jgi:hypothetical protein
VGKEHICVTFFCDIGDQKVPLDLRSLPALGLEFDRYGILDTSYPRFHDLLMHRGMQILFFWLTFD